MSNRIRRLILEDSPADAELVERELRRGGLAIVPPRVATRDAYVRALDEFRPRIVLAGYSLPDFDGIGRRDRVARSRGPDRARGGPSQCIIAAPGRIPAT